NSVLRSHVTFGITCLVMLVLAGCDYLSGPAPPPANGLTPLNSGVLATSAARSVELTRVENEIARRVTATVAARSATPSSATVIPAPAPAPSPTPVRSPSTQPTTTVPGITPAGSADPTKDASKSARPIH